MDYKNAKVTVEGGGSFVFGKDNDGKEYVSITINDFWAVDYLVEGSLKEPRIGEPLQYDYYIGAGSPVRFLSPTPIVSVEKI